MPAQTRIQLRRGTAAAGPNQWTNQILYAGEVGYETDTGKFKIGNGTTPWDGLGYSSILPAEIGEIIDDRVALLLQAGSNISLNYNDTANTLTISSTASSNLSTEDVEDIIGTKLVPGSGISIDYNDELGTTTVSLSDPIINVADIVDFDEGVDDRVNELLTEGPGIGLSYEDNNNKLFISVTGINLSVVNGIDATESEINYLQGSTPGLAIPNTVLVAGADNSIQDINNIYTSGNLNVGGDLIVGGSSVTVNTETVTIEDPIITLGGTGIPTLNDNKDRGVEFKYFTDSDKIGFFGYDNSAGKFIFLTNATNNDEVFSGDLGTIDANLPWSRITDKPDLNIFVNLTGDVAGSGNVLLTDLSDGGINISTTVQPNSIALGADTTGLYIENVFVGGPGLFVVSGIGSNTDARSVTVKSNATPISIPETIVARDENSSFSANTIYGLTALSGTSLASPTYLYNAVIDGGTP